MEFRRISLSKELSKEVDAEDSHLAVLPANRKTTYLVIGRVARQHSAPVVAVGGLNLTAGGRLEIRRECTRLEFFYTRSDQGILGRQSPKMVPDYGHILFQPLYKGVEFSGTGGCPAFKNRPDPWRKEQLRFLIARSPQWHQQINDLHLEL